MSEQDKELMEMYLRLAASDALLGNLERAEYFTRVADEIRRRSK